MKPRVLLSLSGVAALVAASVALPVASHAAETKTLTASAQLDRNFRPLFVGVEIMPVDGPTRALFKLPETGGLLVIGVSPKSPADGVLGQGDILLKLEEQVLVNRDQLRALFRTKKAGDEVALTIVRGGRTETVKLKLAEAPLMTFSVGPMQLGSAHATHVDTEELMKRLNDHTKRLSAHGGVDSSVLDEALKDSNISIYPGDSGSVTGADGAKLGVTVTSMRSRVCPEGKVIVTKVNDAQTVVVKDKDGKTIAEGPITDELRATLPSWALEVIDGKSQHKKPEAKPAEGES